MPPEGYNERMNEIRSKVLAEYIFNVNLGNILRESQIGHAK